MLFANTTMSICSPEIMSRSSLSFADILSSELYSTTSMRYSLFVTLKLRIFRSSVPVFDSPSMTLS